MAWQTPKTNWQAGDIPGAGDFNRTEGNAEYLKGQVDGVKTRLGTTRFKKLTVTINPNEQVIVTHNLNSTNVLVDISPVSDEFPGFTEAARSNIYYRVLNANQVAFIHQLAAFSRFTCTIIRLDW